MTFRSFSSALDSFFLLSSTCAVHSTFKNLLHTKLRYVRFWANSSLRVTLLVQTYNFMPFHINQHIWEGFSNSATYLCSDSSLGRPTGESCPENGRSPGSVSTQHSSPRSDFTYGNSTSTPQAPNAGMGNAGMGNAGATSDGTSNTQPSDVIISRKESEGFGFVIISSLNRPEAATTNSESSDY